MDCVMTWLTSEIDDYKDRLQTATSEFFLAEMNLNRHGPSEKRLSEYYHASLDVALTARDSGDDMSYLLCLKKLYTRMMAELNDTNNELFCRSQCKVYALDSLNLTCQLYKGYDVMDKAKILRTDFAKRSSIT